PNLEMHIYGNGGHGGGLTARGGIPFGTWTDRFLDWFQDLGFLDKPGRPTKAAADVDAFARKSAQDAPKKVDPKPDSAKQPETPTTKPGKHGVLLHDARAFPGYNLINPGRKQTYLFDNEGRVVHTWTSEHRSGAAAYLLDNGHLF